ncbi:hypothetical protein [Corallococcus sp. EGB]|uniref:hypothetical protein n=1 Tax=Corallococcus sp. EGB TaxID=1521117 RepID=UPI001CC081CB|nr:hypothetical protein [Corallococcus sp. EGB]
MKNKAALALSMWAMLTLACGGPPEETSAQEALTPEAALTSVEQGIDEVCGDGVTVCGRGFHCCLCNACVLVSVKCPQVDCASAPRPEEPGARPAPDTAPSLSDGPR